MKLSLIVATEGKAYGQAIPVKLPQFLIGRDPQCNLRPASPVISKRHCVLITKNDKVFVRDFDSTNGTFVNEEQIKGQRELKNGDVLKLGPILFKIQLEGAASVDRPTPRPANRNHDGGEDDAAAMLLLPDDGAVSAPEAETAEASIPGGTTVMDMPAVGGMEAAVQAKAAQAAQAEEKKDAKTKVEPPPNTASAAAAILAKYSRRTRN